MRLVVWIIFLISNGNRKRAIKSSLLFFHERIAYGYFPLHSFLEKSRFDGSYFLILGAL